MELRLSNELQYQSDYFIYVMFVPDGKVFIKRYFKALPNAVWIRLFHNCCKMWQLLAKEKHSYRKY